MITQELRAWHAKQTAAGHTAETLLQSMLQSGWTLGEAGQALQLLMTEQKPTEDANGLPPAVPVPEPNVADSPLRLPTDGISAYGNHGPIEVLMQMKHTAVSPRVVLFGNFLSPLECDALIAGAEEKMKRSQTVQTQTGGDAIHEARTSSGMFYERAQTETVATIEARIAQVLRWPVENGEGLQILHYKPGAEYQPHYDYFDPFAAGTPRILARGGQRVGTLIMYLSEPSHGGGTLFPDVGLEIAPKRGSALFFSYNRAHPSTKSFHAGAPVIAGEKWIATKWLREGEFV